MTLLGLQLKIFNKIEEDNEGEEKEENEEKEEEDDFKIIEENPQQLKGPKLQQRDK